MSIINILVTILSSNDSDLLKVSVSSVIDAINILPEKYKSLIIFTPIIVVNSLNKNYYIEVINNFNDKNIQIIETESNGLPGKGFNSIISLFRKNPQFDWLFPLDGDDLVYLTAFWQLADFIISNKETQIDILFTAGLDKITYTSVSNSTLITKGVYIKTLENINIFKEFYQYFKSPFETQFTEIGVPARICLINRNAVNIVDPKIEWEESANMLDDYNPFLAAFTHFLNGTLKIAIHCNRYIYLYNLLNNTNVTSQFIKDFKQDYHHLTCEQEKFSKNISKYNSAKINWHKIQDIPFINLPEHANYKKTMTKKIEYLTNTLVRHYFNKHMSELEVLYEKTKYDEYITHTLLLLKRYPELLSERQQLWLRMNLGVCYYNCIPKKIAVARAEWNLSLLNANKDPQIDIDLKDIVKKNLLLCANDISDAVSNY